MKTEFKVLLYLKRNGQGKDGLCPLMGRIMIKATGNSTTQFGCKIRVDPKLWNATSQRCTGKSRMAIATNRAIDKMMLQKEMGVRPGMDPPDAHLCIFILCTAYLKIGFESSIL